MNGKITQTYGFKDDKNPVFEYKKPNPKGYKVTAFVAKIWDGKQTNFTGWRDVPIDGDIYTFELTSDERNSLLSYASNLTTLTVFITLLTEINGVEYEDTATATMFIENAEPIISATVKDVNAATVALTGDNQKFIRYFSNSQYTISAAARKAATLKSYSIKCGSSTMHTATGTFERVTSNTYYLTATDSRGLTTNNFLTKDLIPYVRLTCNKVNIDDFTAQGALTFSISGKYFNGSFGKVSNSMQMQYRIKDSDGNLYVERTDSGGTPTGEMIPFNDDGESSGWVELGEVYPSAGSNDTYTYSRTLTGLDYLKSYEILVNVNDALTPVQSSSTVAAVTPIFDWSNEDFNFNVPTKASKNIIVPNTRTDLASVQAGGGVYYKRTDGQYADLISVIGNTIYVNNCNSRDANIESAVMITGNDIDLHSENTNIMADSIDITVDDILINGNTVDYVIENGTDNLYSYRKWNSGKLEAWRSTQNTIPITTSKQDGALYYTSDWRLTVSGTPAFTAVESVQLTINKNGSVGLFLPVLISTGISSGVVTINFLVVNSSNTTANVIPYAHIIGRWK